MKAIYKPKVRISKFNAEFRF